MLGQTIIDKTALRTSVSSFAIKSWAVGVEVDPSSCPRNQSPLGQKQDHAISETAGEVTASNAIVQIKSSPHFPSKPSQPHSSVPVSYWKTHIQEYGRCDNCSNSPRDVLFVYPMLNACSHPDGMGVLNPR